jgi:hypothetical protein
VQENTRAAPRLMAVAAIALVAAALAAFAWLSNSDVAGAAGNASGQAPSGQFQPVQDNGSDQQAAPDRDNDGHPCPEEQGGGGSRGDSGSGSGSDSQQQAPSGSSTPDTEL